MEKPGFIVPPPGLIPAVAETTTETQRTSGPRRSLPVFVPVGPAQVAPVTAVPPAPAAVTAETPIVDLPDDSAALRGVSRWRLILADDSSVTMSSSLVLGRKPQTVGEWHGAATLSINDPERSVSKTHAALLVDGPDLFVVDLESTNGVVVVGDDGSVTTVAVGARHRIQTNSTLELGSFVLRVERD